MDRSETQETYFEEESVEVSAEESGKAGGSGEMEVEDPFAGVDLSQLLAEADQEDDGGTGEEETPQDSITQSEPAGKTTTVATRLVHLPMSRVKHIIQQDPDVDRINKEAIFVITKATELFIEAFTKEVYKVTARAKKKTIQMRDINTCIDDVCCMQFLEGIFPHT